MNPDDSDVANAIYLARKLHLTIHIRGSDSHPVVELKEKNFFYDPRANGRKIMIPGKIIGGIELRRRIEQLRKRGELE